MNRTGRPPCRENPAGWDIPQADPGQSTTIRAQVRKAITLCNTCPARKWCRQQAQTTPPEHSCIQGGLIWPGVSNCTRDPLEQRLARAAQPVPYEQWRPVPDRTGRPARTVRTHTGPAGPPTADDRCGTEAGGAAHRRRHERLCLPCRQVTRHSRAHAVDMPAVVQAVAGSPPAGLTVHDREAIAEQLLGWPIVRDEMARRMGCTRRNADRIVAKLRATGRAPALPSAQPTRLAA